MCAIGGPTEIPLSLGHGKTDADERADGRVRSDRRTDGRKDEGGRGEGMGRMIGAQPARAAARRGM